MAEDSKFPWLWDVPIDNRAFLRILRGEHREKGLDRKWAMARLIEYAPYRQIRELLPLELFLEHWSEVAPLVRSSTRREGMDYLHKRLSARGRAA
jgi:hypothetical protein